ncbi:MAG: Sir2 family NAD+-dependent deacetylase [Alphaproteobacteria bacterium]
MYQNIVILTGAGISAESGLSTFRDNGGLWNNHRIEDVATPEAFARNPELVQKFYNIRRAQLKDVQPNAAHIAIAELAKKWPGRVTVITQNVDDLHERVMPESIIHMHGELKKARCSITEKVYSWEEGITADTPCPCCKKTGRLRPHIVWFGEMPLYMDLISHLLAECDLFMSIGTSGTVYPAAGFVHEVRTHGRAHTVVINLEPSNGYSLFHEKIYGKAGEVLPEYVDKILKNI